jgi:menaquinone-dependent protoporphyrinogen IX oxidase
MSSQETNANPNPNNTDLPKKTLILFGSKYGTTEEIAHTIAKGLSRNTNTNYDPSTSDSVVLANFKKLGPVKSKIHEFERIILGAPIYAGRSPGYIARFVDKYEHQLRIAEVHLFIICSARGEEARVNLEQAFTPWILAHAKSKNTFGGRIILDKLKSMDSFLIKRAANVLEDVDTIDHKAIELFIESLNS